MPKRSDVRTLKNLIDQAHLIASSEPMPKGGIESLRENLDAARALIPVLLVRPSTESIAAELGKRGGSETAKRGSEYYSQIAGLRKIRAGGRPKKHQDVLTSGARQSEVRSRAAFLIVKRMRELNLDTEAVAKAIHSSEQYVRNLIQGVTIPSDEKVNALIKGLDMDNVQADQLRTLTAEDRRRNDGRFRGV
jgi:hypothetical protein